jgi:nucleoside-diphosphate-sugar epimerase
MKILITGASGFIGTNVLDYFAKDNQVLNLDINPPKDDKWNKYWHNVDITDFNQLHTEVVNFDPDYIIHLAARTDLDGQTVEDYTANTIGVKNILATSADIKRLNKILITSSMLVCHAGYMPKHQKDYCPTTAYGESKVETENIVWNNKPKCDWAILRPTSIWGAWFGVPYRNFFDVVKNRMYFHIGHRSCTKTYGYVENVVYQIEQILLNDTRDEANKVFYLGDEPAIQIEEWANQIAKELGFTIPRMPYSLLKCAGWIGDVLKLFKIHFPMTSFRLKNMTTNNIINLANTYKIAPNPPVDRISGIRKTLKWMHNHK